MKTTITLAAALHQLDETSLRGLIDARVSSASSIKDWFDLADALQTSESIHAGLSRLTREELAAAHTTPDPATRARLEALGLAVDGTLLDGAREALRDLASHTNLDAPAPSEPTTPLDETTERASRENALTLASRVDELLDLIEATGLRAISRGGISAADTTRVTAVIGELPTPLPDLVALLATTGMIALSDTHWVAADLSQWRATDNIGRWSMLASAWLATLPTELLASLSACDTWSTPLIERLNWMFPLDNQWLLADLSARLSLTEALGLTAGARRTTLGTLLIAGDTDGAKTLLASHVPAHIDKVMLQSDLTIIAPGPLRPDLEVQLRQFATVESRSLASTYRLNPVLISRAMDAGATAASIEAFLGTISSTGIPQPVAYLIADIGKKHASVRVRGEGRASLVSCSDAALASRLAADSNLTMLEFTPNPGSQVTLISPFDSSVVMRNLLAAKYPAVLENDTGEIQRWIDPTKSRAFAPRGASPSRTSLSTPRNNTTSSLSVVAVDALMERLRGTTLPNKDSDEQWLTRQIELAIRTKSVLVVTIALPDGTNREFTVEPRALNNGRLRALDKRSEVERTIPLTSVSAMRTLA